ncbi:MAG: helix-turn-helix domain-containing protein [Gemmatimonadota bacterium]
MIQSKVITEWEAAAALLDPIRRQVLERLIEPDSAAGVARALGLPRQKVAYHVRELERFGLIEALEERRRGNCVERVVRAIARRFVISPEVLGGLGLSEADAMDKLSSDYLVAVAAQTVRDVSGLRERALAARQQLPTLTLQLDLRFGSAKSRASFASELAEFLAASVRRYHEPDATAGRTYRFNVTGYPAPPAQPMTPSGG